MDRTVSFYSKSSVDLPSCFTLLNTAIYGLFWGLCNVTLSTWNWLNITSVDLKITFLLNTIPFVLSLLKVTFQVVAKVSIFFKFLFNWPDVISGSGPVAINVVLSANIKSWLFSPSLMSFIYSMTKWVQVLILFGIPDFIFSTCDLTPSTTTIFLRQLR